MGKEAGVTWGHGGKMWDLGYMGHHMESWEEGVPGKGKTVAGVQRQEGSGSPEFWQW